MGLEPTTFCMPTWRAFAPVPSGSLKPRLQRLLVGRANDSEPERTLSAAIAAIVIGATFIRVPGGATRTRDRR